ncbi:MAG: hemolysin family protein [Thermoleophilaceae bacterium]
MAFELVIALALVVANGFFVATEFAIARMRPTQVDALERRGRPGAKSVRHAVDRIDAYLAACQLGITIASIGLGVVGKPVFEDLLHPVLGDAAVVGGIGLAGAMAFGIITLLHVVVGELSPKSLAIARTERTIVFLAPPMRAFYLATKPLVDLFNGLGNLLLKPFGIPTARESGSQPHTEDEIRSLLRESDRLGLIDPQERSFAEHALTFGDRRAREVMIPRPEIAFVTTEQDLAGAVDAMLDAGRTRLPVCEPSGLDEPVGMVHVKDLLRAVTGDRPSSVAELVRPLPRIADGTLVEEVMRDMRAARQHMALVVDEHGTTIGLLTLEDLLEEIVGEIEDEFDPHVDELFREEGGELLVQGSAPVFAVGERLGAPFDGAHEGTIGGHVIERLGRRPEAGETIDIDGHSARVLDVDEAHIRELAFRRREPEE